MATRFVALSESTYEGGLTQPMHGHEHAYITYVLSGSYDERSAGTLRTVRAAALVFHPHGEEHAVRFRAPETRAFRVQPGMAMIEAQRYAGVCLGSMLHKAAGARAIVARMRECHLEADPVAPLIIDNLACDLLASCAATRRREAADHAGAHRARDRIEADFPNAPALDELAVAAGCHPITLTRAFRRTFGCSIGMYVRRRRLEHAARLLQHTGLPIAEIAILSGFSDQAHLTRGLRSHIGLTPAALRTSLSF